MIKINELIFFKNIIIIFISILNFKWNEFQSKNIDQFYKIFIFNLYIFDLFIHVNCINNSIQKKENSDKKNNNNKDCWEGR